MLNLNSEIRVQKPELAFRDEHLTNFLLASMPSTYEDIIDNLNMHDILTSEETVCALRTKETELTDLGVIKEERANFAARGRFCGGRGERGGAGKENEEELEYVQFLELSMEVIQFKVIPRAPR